MGSGSVPRLISLSEALDNGARLSWKAVLPSKEEKDELLNEKASAPAALDTAGEEGVIVLDSPKLSVAAGVDTADASALLSLASEPTREPVMG